MTDVQFPVPRDPEPTPTPADPTDPALNERVSKLERVVNALQDTIFGANVRLPSIEDPPPVADESGKDK